MISNDIKKAVFHPLSDISSAMVQMNYRIETDPGAKEFKERQVKQSLNGTSLNVLMQVVDDVELKKNLLKTLTSQDSHLSLKRAQDINCNSPMLSNQVTVSALELHDRNSICDPCAKGQNFTFNTAPVNPFNCWRRGHRSSNYGFLYNILLRSGEHSPWRISRKTRLQTSAALKHRLENMKSSIVHEFFSPELRELSGRSMMVVITIRMKELEVSDGTPELSSLLSSQLLYSKHISDFKSDDKLRRGSLEELQNTVGEVLQAIKNTWKVSRLSIQNNIGIISGAIIYHGEEETVEALRGPMTLHIESDKVSTIKYEDISSESIREMFGFDKKEFDLQKSDAALCLFLDPIVDLAVNE